MYEAVENVETVHVEIYNAAIRAHLLGMEKNRCDFTADAHTANELVNVAMQGVHYSVCALFSYVSPSRKELAIQC